VQNSKASKMFDSQPLQPFLIGQCKLL